MKIFRFNVVAIVCIAILSINSCKEEETDPITGFEGNYVLSKATLADPLAITTNELGAFSVPAGTNITTPIQTALLSSAACSSLDKSYVELRADFSIFLSCEGANPINAGTWVEDSSTELTLNLNSTAVPSSPTGISIQVKDMVKTSQGLTGKTTVPLSKAMVSAIVAPLTLVASTPDIITVKFALEFTKK